MAVRLWTSLIAAGLLASQAVSADSDFDNRWYIAPGVGLVFMDSDRGVNGEAVVSSFSVGRFFTPDFSLDLRHDRYSNNISGVPSGMNRFKLRNYGLVGRYHLANFDGVRPYVLVGAGIQQHDSIFDKGRDAYGAVGLGLSHAFNDRVSLRLEGEARYDNDRESLNRSSGFWDWMVSSSLKIKLGAAPAPPPEPAPAPAAPPPRPAPPPPPPPAPEPEPEVIFEFDATVTFGLDSAQLRPGAIAELNEAAALLNLHPEITRIEVAGHTCDLGPAAHNQGLSERRAQAVRDFLVDNGVSADRLVVRGYGEDRPKVANTSDRNRQQNRRVELVVLERSGR
ncbi:MAG: OmpA family protein [Wenzhouxiangella sp.]|nr:MAG: OmpA family protein [Wenzhouxiangella sp.]